MNISTNPTHTSAEGCKYPPRETDDTSSCVPMNDVQLCYTPAWLPPAGTTSQYSLLTYIQPATTAEYYKYNITLLTKLLFFSRKEKIK